MRLDAGCSILDARGSSIEDRASRIEHRESSIEDRVCALGAERLQSKKRRTTDEKSITLFTGRHSIGFHQCNKS
ncbi:MAG: hypothetical protein AB1797_07305 [bacterium]